MGANVWERKAKSGVMASLTAAAVVVFAGSGAVCRLEAAGINPQVFKTKFEKARKDAQVVAQVRVLAAVCTAAKQKNGPVTLQLSLQVLDVKKGKVKKNDVLVVSHQVTPAAGPGPRAYGYMAALRQFPFTPGVQGSVALNWDKEHHRYSAVAGWVAEPNHSDIPTEIGKAYVAGDSPSQLK